MTQTNLKDIPNASKVNIIDIRTANNADWEIIYSYIENSASHIAINWGVYDDYLVEETVMMAAEKVFKYRDCYNSAYSLTTWLTSITRNSLIDILNKDYERRKLDVSITDKEGNLTIDQTAEENMLGNNVKALNMIYNYLDGLKKDDRIIMEMTLNDFSSAQIAKATGKTVNAVNIAKCRIRKKSREDLRDSVLEILFQTA